MRTLVTILGLMALCIGPACSEELTVGPWQVTYDGNTITGLAYEGRVILKGSSVIGFNPKWKGSYFNMSGGTVSATRNGDTAEITWEKETPGVFRARAVLKLDAQSADWSVALTAEKAGPVEVGVLVPPKAVQAAPGVTKCTIGPSELTIGEHMDFGTASARDRVLFETPECDLLFRTRATDRAWMLQDKRGTGLGALRLIIGLTSDGKAPLAAEVGVRLEVTKYGAAEAAARRKQLAQRGREVLPVEIKNADFEAGDKADGWSCPGAVVQDNPAQGKRCARLMVKSEKDRSVYITQRVPVEPGSRYKASAMIRAEDVKHAKVLGMSSVGAVLIVEWADKNGKWLASGAYSKKGWFGTHGWTRHHCDSLIAPAKAGYAIVFLALRGTGTAWFDDVKLMEVRRRIVLSSPADGAELKRNRPRLQWREELDAEAFDVQLSQDKNFAEGAATQTAGTEVPRFVPDRPLPPGTYYWRVRMIPGRWWSKAWCFTQTAATDADAMGPEITPISQSLTDPKEPLRLRLADPSGIDADSIKVRGIEGASFRIACEDDTAQIRHSQGWPRGAHHLTVEAADKQGNRSAEDFWIVMAPPPPKTLTWTCQRGVFDGEKHIFPFGIYQVKPEDYAKVKAAGFNMVHQYTWEGSQDDEKARAYLDGVHAAGLTAFVGFDRGGHSKNGLVQMNYAHVAHRLAALRDHPGLLAWYLFDEPDLPHQYVAPRNMQAWYRFIKALDPYHPVIVTLACRGSIAKYGKGCYDVYWTMAYRDTDYITELIERHQKQLGPDRPHLVILHSYDRDQRSKMAAGEPVDEAAFQPDLRLFRANAYMALVYNSSGLCWWWYGDGGRRFLSVGDVPAAWGWLSQVVAEVRQLLPVLTAEGEILPVSVTCDPPDAKARAWAKKTASGITVIAVSADAEREATLTIRSDAFPGAAGISVKFEGRELKLSNRSITDRFAPNETHVYEIRF